jgi:RNA polymerase sigma-B factor
MEMFCVIICLRQRRDHDPMNSAGVIVVRSPSRPGDNPATLVHAYRRGGDAAARERLVELFMPLVWAVARRYTNRGERFEDLVQVGAIGLIEAIDRFDPARGADFASFAAPTITGAIRHHLRDRAAVIRIPRRLAELTWALRPQRQSLTRRLSRPPTPAELARETGLSERDVLEASETELARTPLALSTDGDPTAGSDPALTVEGPYASCDDRLTLMAGLRTLTIRERRVMHLYFFAGLSQAEIAEQVGLSQVQVSRLIRASVERLRSALGVERPPAATWARDGAW